MDVNPTAGSSMIRWIKQTSWRDGDGTSGDGSEPAAGRAAIAVPIPSLSAQPILVKANTITTRGMFPGSDRIGRIPDPKIPDSKFQRPNPRPLLNPESSVWNLGSGIWTLAI